MKLAIEQAGLAAKVGDMPIGAVLVSQGQPIAVGRNAKHSDNRRTSHAEINAMRDAVVNMDWAGEDCSIYCTLEPCVMCFGAIVNSRISRIIYALEDKKSGFSKIKWDLPYFERFMPIVSGGILRAEYKATILAYDHLLQEKIGWMHEFCDLDDGHLRDCRGNHK